MEVLHSPNRGDDKVSFPKIRLFDGVDFSPCCRLCLTLYDEEKMTPLFGDHASLISSIITKIIPLEIKYGDGLPDSICDDCIDKLNFVHNFIEESFAADEMLRKALAQALALNSASSSAVFDVRDAVDLISTGCDPIGFENLPFDMEGDLICIEPINFQDSTIDFDDDIIEFPSNSVALECETILSSGLQIVGDSGDHNYCMVPGQPPDPAVPCMLRIERDQSLVVLELTEPNGALETKRGYASFVDPASGETSLVPLECHILSSHELERVRARLEPDKQHAMGNLTSTLELESTYDEMLSKAIIRKKIIPGQQTRKKKTKRTPRPYEPVRSVSCEICGKEFFRRTNLRDHMYTHTGERPFTCITCGRGYARSYELNNHIRTHTESIEVIAPFVCEICGRRNVSASSLRSHMIAHSNIRPFECPICKKGFKHKAHIPGHLLTHVEKKQFGCTICGKNFKEEESCLIHEAAHVREPLPPHGIKFQCHLCGKAFRLECSLKIHLETHASRSRDFECAHCNKWFFCREGVKRHIRVVHLAERLFPCTVCDRTFKNPSSVKKHMRIIHITGGKPVDANRSLVNVSS